MNEDSISENFALSLSLKRLSKEIDKRGGERENERTRTKEGEKG